MKPQLRHLLRHFGAVQAGQFRPKALAEDSRGTLGRQGEPVVSTPIANARQDKSVEPKLPPSGERMPKTDAKPTGPLERRMFGGSASEPGRELAAARVE